MRWLLCLFPLLCFAAPAQGQEGDLAPLAAKLAIVRDMPKDKLGERGGSAELTEAKHLLRDWVEHELAGLGQADEAAGLGDRLNKRLKAAGLECETPEDPQGKRCTARDDDPEGWFDARGYMSDIKFSWVVPHNYLVLMTSAGIECGYDDSAYVYHRDERGWHRILESERDTYTPADYQPQTLSEVLVSDEGASGRPPLVLTTGISPWCSSNWQAVYYRLWRVAPDKTTPQPLAEGDESVFAGTDSPVQARLDQDGAYIEFADRSIDPGAFTRTVVRHFRVGPGGRAVRVAPFAFTPRALVDEWLVRPWAESARFTDPKARARLAAWYRKLHSTIVSGGFGDEGGHCRDDPTQWVVGVSFDDPPIPVPRLYFRLRWVAPNDFTLLDIAAKPPAFCRPERVPVDDNVIQFPHELGP